MSPALSVVLLITLLGILMVTVTALVASIVRIRQVRREVKVWKTGYMALLKDSLELATEAQRFKDIVQDYLGEDFQKTPAPSGDTSSGNTMDNLFRSLTTKTHL